MIARMPAQPFTFQSADDLELACEIECDAESIGVEATIERYMASIGDPAAMPAATDAAIEVAIRAACTRHAESPLESARALAMQHPSLSDAIHAVALGLGLPSADAQRIEVHALLLGRWRILEILGSGATAQVARARDELLSSGGTSVEVVIKRFEDGVGGDARLHAFREMRALLGAPQGLASRVVALHAPRNGATCIVTLHEHSRQLCVPDDLATAVHAVRRLHRAGWSHGDLKPEHIRIRPDGSVLFIDFGAAEPASAESCRRDLVRLFEMTTHGRRRNAAHTLSRMALATRRNGVIAFALQLASPRWRRRALAGGCAATLAATAAVWGWQSWRLSSRQSDAFAALAATGRLVDATIDSQGRLISMRLDLPEMTAVFPDAAGQRIVTGPVRFHRDGKVEIFDADGNPMSR